MSNNTAKAANTNFKGYTRKQVAEIVKTYVLNCIPSSEDILSEWGKTTTSDKDRLQFVFDCFSSEYNYPYNKKIHPNKQQRLAEWFKGLPSAFNLDFENYEIIRLSIEWGYLPENPTEHKQQDTINNWFTRMAFNLIRIARKEGVIIPE
jgi:hypothetical protein